MALDILRQAEGQVSLVIRREPDISASEDEEEQNEPPPVPPLSPLPLEEPPIEISEIETLMDHHDEIPVGLEVPHTKVDDSHELNVDTQTVDEKGGDSLGNYERNAELFHFDHEPAELQLKQDEKLTPEKQPFEPDPPLSPLPDDDNEVVATTSPLSMQPPFTDQDVQESTLSASSPPPATGEQVMQPHNRPSSPVAEIDDEAPGLPQTPPPVKGDEGLPIEPSPASSDTDDEETPPPLTSLSPVPDDQMFQESPQSNSPLNSLTNLPVDLELVQPAVGTPAPPLEDEEDLSDFEDDIELPMELRLDDSDSMDDLQPDHYLDDAPPIPYTPPPLGNGHADLSKSEELLSPTHV